jgi:hypothetical protein
VDLLIAGIVVILVLGMGGLLLVRGKALVELSREARRTIAQDDAQTTTRRRRRVAITLVAVVVWYAIAAGLLVTGNSAGGSRLAAALVAAWIVLSVGVGFTVAIWWDVRHDNF